MDWAFCDPAAEPTRKGTRMVVKDHDIRRSAQWGGGSTRSGCTTMHEFRGMELAAEDENLVEGGSGVRG